ncbi:MAG: C25 family peptidase propeptide domain-containing protein, partial [Candidatus Helarchaeota archaeon]
MIKNARWFAFQEKDEDYETVETTTYGKIPAAKFRKLRSISEAKEEYNPDEKIFKINVVYRPKGVWYKKFEELSQVKSKKDRVFVDLLMPSGGAILEPGAPMLPTEGLLVALPPGAVFKEFKIVDFVEKKFPELIDVLPAPKPTKDNGKEWEPPEYEPNEEIYEKDELFPQELVKIMSTDYKIGSVPIVHLIIHPLRYKPKSRELYAYSKIELDIFYNPAPSEFRRFRGKGAGRTLPPRPPSRTIRSELKSEILNIESVDRDVSFGTDGEMGIMT